MPNRLRDIRTQQGYTQSEVASALKIHVITYHKYENGSRELSATQASALADFYGVTIDYLLGRSDTPSTNEQKITPNNELIKIAKDAHTDGERLRLLRLWKGLRQDEVAQIAGVSLRSYQNYERNDSDMSASVAKALADYYAVSVDYLFCRTDSPDLALTNATSLDPNNPAHMAYFLRQVGINDNQLKTFMDFCAFLKSSS